MTSAAFHTFSLDFGRDDGTVVIRVLGELDGATAPLLRAALTSVIDDQGNLSVRLDLGEMTFVDTTGLSVFVDGLKRLRDKGGSFTLANPRRSTRRLFEIAGLTQVFRIVDTSDAGAAHAAEGARAGGPGLTTGPGLAAGPGTTPGALAPSPA